MQANVVPLLLVLGCGGDDIFHGGPSDAGPDEDASPDFDPWALDRPSDEIYARDFVPSFEIRISDEDWQTLISDPDGDDWVRPYVPATFVYRDGDEVLENVGVHFQGGFSLANVRNGKYGFTIHFDEFDDGRTWRGLRHLKLKMPGFDPSLLVEPIAYDVYRAMGLDVPRANHARLWVNDEYYGVYVNVEDVDQSFVSRRFRRDWGELWKMADGDWSSDFIGGYGDAAWRFRRETNEDDGGAENVAALLAVWEDPALAGIERHLDVDRALRQIACDLALDNWDGMSTAAWNFYLYRDVDAARFRTIPWGPDASFDAPGGMSVFDPPKESSQRLVDAYPDEYAAILRELVDGPFDAERLAAALEADYERIRAHEADDWRNVAEFEAEVPNVRGQIEIRAQAVAGQVP